MSNQHPDTYEEALEQAIDQADNLDEEKRERNKKQAKKAAPAKPAAPMSATDKARAIVKAKLAAR